MKKLFYPIILSVLLSAAGCTENETGPEIEQGTATVTLSLSPMSEDSTLVLTVTPSEGAVSYQVYCAQDADLASFVNGVYDGEERFQSFEGSAPSEVRYENLEDGYYTVLALAVDADGRKGSVASVKAWLPDGSFSSSVQFVSDRAAAIQTMIPYRIIETHYYLGTPGEKEKFENGEVEVTVKEDYPVFYVATYTTLEPSTDYVFYVRGLDRFGMFTETIEIPFRTMDEGTAPACKAEVISNDVYSQTVVLTPNSNCSKVVAMAMNKGTHNVLYDLNWGGNIAGCVEAWNEYASTGIPLEVGTTSDWTCGVAKEMYWISYDENGTIANLQHMDYSIPSEDSSLPAPSCTLEISDITSSGATYTVTADENTLAVWFETLEKDFYEEIVAGDYGDYYLHEYMFAMWYNNNDSIHGFLYGTDTATFTEQAGTPGTEYYVVAVPVGFNGPYASTGGWGPMVVDHYTTLSE